MEIQKDANDKNCIVLFQSPFRRALLFLQKLSLLEIPINQLADGDNLKKRIIFIDILSRIQVRDKL